MLNDDQKMDYQIFYCSRLREHSNRLSFSNSNVVIVLTVTVAVVHNYVTSHTEVT